MIKILQLFLFTILVTQSVYSAPMNAKTDFNSHEAYLKALGFSEKGEFGKAIELYEELLVTESSSSIYDNYLYALIETNQIDKAVKIAHIAEEKFPSVLLFPLFLGQYYQSTDIDKAISYYDKAIKLSDKVDYKIAKASLLETKGDFKGALAIYNLLLKTTEEPIYYSNIGRIYQKYGKTNLAIKNYKIAIDKSNDLISILRLADLYLTSGKTDEAKKYLEQIVNSEDVPEEAKQLPEIKLGELYIYDKNYKKAIDLYRSLADKVVGAKRAHVLKVLGNLQSELNDFDNASKTFELAFEIAPEDTIIAYLAGYLYEKLGNNDKAKEIYEKALKISPNYVFLIKRVAYLHILDNQTDLALTKLQQISEVEKDVEFYVLLAEVYNQKKDHNKAIITLLDGLNSNPTSDEILYSLTFQYDASGEKTKALDTIKKALQLSPDNPIYLNYLGYTYADKGINIEEAYNMISKALEKDPKNPAYLDSMGWVLYRKNDFKNALKYIDEALKYAPDEKDILEHRDIINKKITSGQK